MAAEPISVLFVDDDEQWAEYIASELETEDSPFSVSVALNANEAVVALDDDDSIDCVVTDFRMPEIDGIQMLEHVQESRPHLPVILVTGDGSEDVAIRAIEAGVTDYIRKDPRVDLAPIFGNRIRQAVERARLRRDVRESEQRYRTVIEQTRDAIVVLRDGEIVFANDRFDELRGAGSEPSSPTDFLLHIHENDRERVDDLLRATRSGDDLGLCEARLIRPSGERRHCELLGESISYEGESAILLSIRDVTLRRSRERTLRRAWEFNRAIQKQLVGVQTREELESAVAAVLSSYGYDLVWIGTVTERGVQTRVTVGESEYIDRLEDTDGSDHGGDPILWSAQTGEAQLIPDFEALMPTNRRTDATECGFRTGYAHPLRYRDIAYGTLAVYHRDPSRIDDTERSLLAEVAETVGFALHHVETQQALTSTAGVVVEVDIEPEEYYLTDLLTVQDDLSSTEVTVDGTQVLDEDTQLQYLSFSTDDPETFADALGEHPSVRSRAVIDSGVPARFRVTVGEDTPEAHLGSVGGLVRSTTVTRGRATISFELSSRQYLQSTIDRLNEHYASVTVRSVVERKSDRLSERQTPVDVGSLTTKQLAAIEAAYHEGYFDRPRRSSASDIAESLGITHTTYLQHLRVAQRKLFRQVFDGPNDASTD
ncbi:response regulator [Halobellus rufus]|uniref:response regulator n=1 Tax=Halobellus rufus TaxID=1448860 RepID=UPI000678F4A7|nr:response regulator [Halobellus rufus]